MKAMRLAAVLALSILVAIQASCVQEKGSAQNKATPKDDAWFTSFEQAQAEAKKTNKPILMDFTGSDWCIWCVKLKKEVFDTQEFKDWATKNVVLLDLDFPHDKPQDAATKKQNEDLYNKYKVEGYPTIIFLSADEKELGRSGYMEGGPKGWIENAGKIIAAK